MQNDMVQYFFRCYNELKDKGLHCMDCAQKPEGILLTLGNQYEILVIETWVNPNAEYCTRRLFSVENDKDNIVDILLKVVERINDNVEDFDEDSMYYYSPIIIDTNLMEQLLDD